MHIDIRHHVCCAGSSEQLRVVARWSANTRGQTWVSRTHVQPHTCIVGVAWTFEGNIYVRRLSEWVNVLDVRTFVPALGTTIRQSQCLSAGAIDYHLWSSAGVAKLTVDSQSPNSWLSTFPWHMVCVGWRIVQCVCVSGGSMCVGVVCMCRCVCVCVRGSTCSVWRGRMSGRGSSVLPPCSELKEVGYM